jgi:hypothetical protein
MYCLLICGKYDDDIAAICPFCHKDIETIDYDDYVEENIVLWCDNCGEILLCCGYIKRCNSIRKYYDEIVPLGSPPCSCVKKITHQQAMQMESDSKILKLLTPLDSWKYFLVGIMEISHSLSESELGNDSDEDSPYDESNLPSLSLMKKFETPIMKLKDSHFDTDHGGTYLFYNAKCSECQRECLSVIWGC